MKDLGYNEGYKYAHDYKGNYVDQQYLPDALSGARFWNPSDNPQEARMWERLQSLKGNK